MHSLGQGHSLIAPKDDTLIIFLKLEKAQEKHESFERPPRHTASSLARNGKRLQKMGSTQLDKF